MDVEKQRQLILLVITGAILVVVIAVFMLIAVWTKEEPVKEEYVYEVGKIEEVVKLTEEEIVQNYFDKL